MSKESCKCCGDDIKEEDDSTLVIRSHDGLEGHHFYHSLCLAGMAGEDFLPSATEKIVQETAVKRCEAIKRGWFGKTTTYEKHNWGKLTEKQNFTDTGAPYQTRTCKNCGKYEIIRVTYRDSA